MLRVTQTNPSGALDFKAALTMTATQIRDNTCHDITYTQHHSHSKLTYSLNEFTVTITITVNMTVTVTMTVTATVTVTVM